MTIRKRSTNDSCFKKLVCSLINSQSTTISLVTTCINSLYCLCMRREREREREWRARVRESMAKRCS